MDGTERQDAVRPGMTVNGADGGKLGKVVVAGADHFIVEKGLFFPTDYYVPRAAIAGIEDDQIHLTVTKDEALTWGWDEPPTEGYSAEYAASQTPAMPAGDAVAESEAVAVDDDRAAVNVVEKLGTVTVPVHEEELRPVTHERELGAVRVEKVVVDETRTVDVPIAEERVRIRQVDAAPGMTPEPDAFEPATIRIPVRGEEVADLHKQTRVVGAVEIEKERVERVERVEGTVRHEEVRVEERVVTPQRSTSKSDE